MNIVKIMELDTPYESQYGVSQERSDIEGLIKENVQESIAILRNVMTNHSRIVQAINKTNDPDFQAQNVQKNVIINDSMFAGQQLNESINKTMADQELVSFHEAQLANLHERLNDLIQIISFQENQLSLLEDANRKGEKADALEQKLKNLKWKSNNSLKKIGKLTAEIDDLQKNLDDTKFREDDLLDYSERLRNKIKGLRQELSAQLSKNISSEERQQAMEIYINQVQNAYVEMESKYTFMIHQMGGQFNAYIADFNIQMGNLRFELQRSIAEKGVMIQQIESLSNFQQSIVNEMESLILAGLAKRGATITETLNLIVAQFQLQNADITSLNATIALAKKEFDEIEKDLRPLMSLIPQGEPNTIKNLVKAITSKMNQLNLQNTANDAHLIKYRDEMAKALGEKDQIIARMEAEKKKMLIDAAAQIDKLKKEKRTIKNASLKVETKLKFELEEKQQLLAQVSSKLHAIFLEFKKREGNNEAMEVQYDNLSDQLNTELDYIHQEYKNLVGLYNTVLNAELIKKEELDKAEEQYNDLILLHKLIDKDYDIIVSGMVAAFSASNVQGTETKLSQIKRDLVKYANELLDTQKQETELADIATALAEVPEDVLKVYKRDVVDKLQKTLDEALSELAIFKKKKNGKRLRYC